MAYENHMPPLSTIDQGTRDFDFIPLTELKEFDSKLNEIVGKINTINKSDATDVNSIAYKLKEIEYNLADAIEFDEDGNVIGLNSTTSDKFNDGVGNVSTIVPEQGPNSYDNLISNLEKYYNEFVRYLGNDVESDQWRIDLQAIFDRLKSNLDSKIRSIFKNSAQASILEEKENNDYNFMKHDSVKLKSDDIVRLNPNVSNYTRNINLMFHTPGLELIVFEVEAAEPENMIFNMKVQNGDLYYNYNVILDNGKFHITKEEHFKLCNYGLELRIYKYITPSNTWRYVFTMTSSSEDVSKVYSFELSGIFINKFIFDSNAAFPTDHQYYWAFHQVDSSGRVDPEKTYYEKRIDDYNDERNQETNIVYTVVDHETEPEPIPGEVYYVKTVDETNTTVYAEYRELTQFEPDVIYYKKHIESTTDDSDKVITYVKVDDLKEFKPGVEYYVKETEFIYIDKIEILEDEYTDGVIDDITIDHKGEKLVNENFKKVIINKKYTKNPIKIQNIDVESSELLTKKKYKEKIANTLNKNIVHLDDGIRFTKSSVPGLLVKSRSGARKINNTFNVGFGSKIVELKTIPPHYYDTVCIPSVKESDLSTIDNITTENIQVTDKLTCSQSSFTINNHTIKYISSEITLYDFYNNKENPIIAIQLDDINLLNFNDIILETSNFISNIKIELAGYVGNSMVDFKVVADDIDDFENCYHIYLNIKDEEIAIPIMKKVLNDGDKHNIVFNLDNIVQIIGNDEKTFIIDNEYKCYESTDGIVWYKKAFKFDKRFAQELNCDKVKVGGFVRDDYTKKLFAIIIPDNLELKNIPIKKLLYAELRGSTDYIKFDSYAETMLTAYNNHVTSTYANYTPYRSITGCYTIALYNNIMVLILCTGSTTNKAHMAIVIDFSTSISKSQTHASKSILNVPNDVTNKYNIVYNTVYNNDADDDTTNDTIIFTFKAKINHTTANLMNFTIRKPAGDITLTESQSTATNPQIYIAQYNELKSKTDISEAYKAVSCYNERFSGGYQNPYEGYFIYINTLGNGAIYFDSNDNSQNIFENVKVYNVVYCGDINTKMAFALTDHGLFVNKTSNPQQSNWISVNTDLTFDENSSVIFANDTDVLNYVWTVFGTNGIMYSHDGSEFYHCKKTGISSLKNIGDIDGKYLIGKTINNSVINDVYDGIFVRNNYDKDRNLYYKKVGNYVFGYGNGNDKTYIIDWVSNDKYTFNTQLDNIFDIDGEIYGIFNTATNVKIYHFIDTNVGFTDITNTISITDSINISSIQQDINGNIFVVGTKINTVVGNTSNNYHFGVIYYGSTLESLHEVLQLSHDSVIDCLYIYDNDVIISTYEPEHPNRIYKWNPNINPNNCSFTYIEEANANNIYSFKRCFAYKGEIFIMNGSGSNPEIAQKGFAKLTKNISINSDNGYWKLNVITPITVDFEIKHENYIFSYASTLFGIFITSTYNSNNELTDKVFHIYVYYEDAGRFIEVNEQIAPLLTAVINTGNDELRECIETDTPVNEYTMCIQETYDESKTPIHNYKPENESEDYRLDKIYFDRENTGITIGNYASETNRFNLISRMAAIGTASNKHKTQLAMVLGKDNMIGIFDKSMNVIKTLKLKYDVMINNSLSKRIDIDDRFVTQNIFVASSNDVNYAFVTVRGKFPSLRVAEDDITIEEINTDIISYKLFKINLDDAIESDDFVLMNTEAFNINQNTTTDEIHNYITTTYGYDVTEDMILNVFNNRQLVGIVNGFMYDNIESIVFWNTESMCLDILSPLDWNEDIDDINAQFNRNNNYRDYNIAIDTVNGKAMQTLFDGTTEINDANLNGNKYNVTFTSIPNELVRVGLKTYIANDFLKSVKSVSFYDLQDRANSALINLNNAQSEYTEAESNLTAIQALEATAQEAFNSAYNSYNAAIDELNTVLYSEKATILAQALKEWTLRTTEENNARITKTEAEQELNNTPVSSENYQSVLNNYNQAVANLEEAEELTRTAYNNYIAAKNQYDSQDIVAKTNVVEAARREYETKVNALNLAKQNTHNAEVNRDRARLKYENAQLIYNSMKSKSLLETVTFDDGLVGKIDPNIVIDRLIHTKFGAIAWDSLTTSRLNPNDRNDLHFVITKSGEIVLDTFTGKGIRYYNKALTTRVGLFRWYDYVTSEDGGAVGNSDLRPKEYNIDSDGFNTGWIYLTPNGGGKIIKINPGVGKYVYRMWDTPFGVFMSVRNYRYYGLSAVEYWSFKQMIAVPVDDTKEISIEDEQYFKELNCNELKILDCCNTQKGLFAVGHSNNKWVTLRYNGDDFYVVDDTAHIVSIIDTTVDTLFLTNVDNEAVYSYNNNTDALAVNNNFNIGNVELSNNKFGQKREDIETIFGPQICVKGGVWNLALKQKINFVDSNGKGPAALQKIRIYIDNESDNLPVIAEYLADKGLPLDVDIKCIGSIMYNGLQVLINGLQIISENGLSKKPQTVKFYIDKNARFTRNRESIEALFGPDENTWETNIKDIGLISDYDPVTEEYYNIPCQISKMNFMVLYE